MNTVTINSIMGADAPEFVNLVGSLMTTHCMIFREEAEENFDKALCLAKKHNAFLAWGSHYAQIGEHRHNAVIIHGENAYALDLREIASHNVHTVCTFVDKIDYLVYDFGNELAKACKGNKSNLYTLWETHKLYICAALKCGKARCFGFSTSEMDVEIFDLDKSSKKAKLHCSIYNKKTKFWSSFDFQAIEPVVRDFKVCCTIKEV